MVDELDYNNRSTRRRPAASNGDAEANFFASA